jgi:HTH-type transcriptional regulator/antitoxin HipB
MAAGGSAVKITPIRIIFSEKYPTGYISHLYPAGYFLDLYPIGFIIKRLVTSQEMNMYIRSPKELGVQIMNERRKLQLTQNQVAEETGIMQKTISALENYPERAQVETLFRILSALNLNLYLSPKGQKNNNKEEWKEEW